MLVCINVHDNYGIIGRYGMPYFFMLNMGSKIHLMIKRHASVVIFLVGNFREFVIGRKFRDL
mgnify:CR=1 FL=1